MPKITSHNKTHFADYSTASRQGNILSGIFKKFQDHRPILNALGQFDVFAVWLLLTTVNLMYHRLIPLDETRYAAVAWEMWTRGDYLIPHLNGVPYHHKPPLLFWLYNLGWSLFGVSEAWILWVSPLCGLANLYWVRYLAAQLWPDNPTAAQTAPWLLLGSLTWGAFMNGAMFDMLLSLCVLLAITGQIKASVSPKPWYWALYAIGCGLGLLAKGPAVLVYIAPSFIFGKLWSDQARTNPARWYLSGSLALLAGFAIALCWFVPAVLKGGDAYKATLLWHQTVDRMVNSFAHKRPFWWYLELSPIILFPWLFWPRLWRSGLNRKWLKDGAFRLCLLWFGGGVIAFSMISGKQVHYILPLMPALALLMSRILVPDNMAFRLSDILPYLLIAVFGMLLLILPKLSGMTLFHWITTRPVWWPWSLMTAAFAGIGYGLLTKRIAPKHYSIAIVIILSFSMAGFFSSQNNGYDLRPVTTKLSSYYKAGEPVAWAGEYEGQFEFLVRLQEPLPVIQTADLWNWLNRNSKGHVILISDCPLKDTRRIKVDYMQTYREQWLMILSSNTGNSN